MRQATTRANVPGMTKVSALELAQLAQVLSAEERLDLIDRLWSSLSDQQVPLTASQVAELRRRDASFASELAAARPLDEVWAELNRDA